MLTEQGWWSVVPNAGVAERDLVADQIDLAVALAHRIDRSARNADLVECDEQVVGGPLTQLVDQDRMELITIRRAAGIETESGILGDVGDSQHLAECAELAIVRGGDDDVAVLRRHV